MIDDTPQSDYTKFAYHEGARIIRAVHDRICEITYTGTPPSQDERESLCDMLIELHQLVYGVTLFTFRGDPANEDDSYRDDEVYSDGRPVVTRLQLQPVDPADEPIPAEAYRGEIGEEVPFGCLVYVWRPGEAEHPLSGDEFVEPPGPDASGPPWKAFADLRTRGQIAWVRDDDGHIAKRPGRYGRACAVSAITAAGCAEWERVHSTAVAACINLVRNTGTAIFPDLERECAELGIDTGGTETVGLADRPHVVWWGGASTEFLDVVDAMIEQEPRIRMRRTSADVYRERGHLLWGATSRCPSSRARSPRTATSHSTGCPSSSSGTSPGGRPSRASSHPGVSRLAAPSVGPAMSLRRCHLSLDPPMSLGSRGRSCHGVNRSYGMQNDVFRIGVTRDVLRPDGSLVFAPVGLELLDPPGIVWDFLHEDRKELGSDQLATSTGSSTSRRS